VAASYVTVVRGIPVLLIFFVYFGIPLLFAVDLAPFLTGFCALTIVGAAYTGEIFRAAIQAAPRGQREAADALGLGYADKTFRVIMPQALRIAVPAMSGFLINLVKDSSLIGSRRHLLRHQLRHLGDRRTDRTPSVTQGEQEALHQRRRFPSFSGHLR
jgi:ABC-type amino acid transport system permease subunit